MSLADLKASRIDVTSRGIGYTQAEAKISPPQSNAGVSAIATVQIKDGQVASVNTLSPGAGYLSATVTGSGDGHGTAARVAILPRNTALPKATIVGRDTSPESVAWVALWVAKNAPTRPVPRHIIPLHGTAVGECD